ncbi:unnamed protein product, partial [Porites evermanni]
MTAQSLFELLRTLGVKLCNPITRATCSEREQERPRVELASQKLDTSISIEIEYKRDGGKPAIHKISRWYYPGFFECRRKDTLTDACFFNRRASSSDSAVTRSSDGLGVTFNE